jgi:hypothetical protein
MTIYIVDLEAVDTRYTKQWKEHLPKQLALSTGLDPVIISGGDVVQSTTPGAFLNFGGTNIYKSKQLEKIGALFCEGKIKDGDYFLYTDAWNPTVLQLRYMAELLGVRIRIGGLWHAGSYDPHDFLGRLIGDKPWVRNTEMAMYGCYDDNFFATKFHIDLFTSTFWKNNADIDRQLLHSIRKVGWPMEYLSTSVFGKRGMEKLNLIVFPHRLAPEKQVDIFRDLAQTLPEYDFVVCQDTKLTKDEYHTLLGQSKVVFSANLQETLGISWYEGLLVNSIPMIPDRLSYSEMAIDEFKYPSDWTKDFVSYQLHKSKIVDRIHDYMANHSKYLIDIKVQKEKIEHEFFSGSTLYQHLLTHHHKTTNED